MDVVFVHGIRGGAFATWRREGIQNLQPGHNPGNLDHPYCWPSTWLPQDVPEARLLSMEYAAPASGWEVRMLCYVLLTYGNKPTFGWTYVQHCALQHLDRLPSTWQHVPSCTHIVSWHRSQCSRQSASVLQVLNL